MTQRYIQDFGDLSAEDKQIYLKGSEFISKRLISGDDIKEINLYKKSLGPSPESLVTHSEWDESMDSTIQRMVGKRLFKRLKGGK